ncbi:MULTISPECIES: ABC transporter permease [Paenibacillus]|uniref:Transport permease YvfS n=1 Tax=Paenibacillus azoreducens TaxID=116718 RepID=A0A919YES6_9BACL|nr:MULTISPECIES: ABC transporter permease [Paenibacillus]MBE9917738.1 ABC transporter permease [Paenibacillus donghaensis]GIO49399.1 putative transport permease YvfS [Paenibacillus azoreducens]
MKMMFMQCKVEMLRIIRNPYFVFWSLMMPILFYFIFTKLVNTGIDNAEAWQAHYLMSMATFSVMGSAIMTVGIRMVQEQSLGWSVYMRITPLPGSIYFISKMFGQTVMHAFSIIVIFIAGFLINGVHMSAGQWIGSGLWILVASIPFLALGTLFGSMKRVDTASGVSNVTYMLMAVLGGMWMPIDNFPSFLQTIGKWLPSYNYGSGVWAIAAGQTPELKSILILAGYLLLFMVLSIYIRKKQEAV